MKLLPLNIGMRRRMSSPAAAASSLCDTECTTAQDRRTRFASKISSILSRKPSSKHMSARFMKTKRRSNVTDESSIEEFESDDDVRTKTNANPRRFSKNSAVGCLPACQLAQLAEDEYALTTSDPNSILIHVLSGDDNEDYGEYDHQEKSNIANTTDSSPSLEESLALEVGHSAHEFLEECFYAEESILDREKFNAITEVVKSDITTTGRLGKGSFSDVFEVVYKASEVATNMSNIVSDDEVVYKGGEIATNMSNTASDDGTESKRRHSAVDIRPTLSRTESKRRRSAIDTRSIPTRTLVKDTMSISMPSLRHHSSLAMKCLRPQIQSDADQFIVGAEDLVHETAILANLNHQHIIKLHGRASGNLTDAFALNDGYFILIDKLHETLPDRIEYWKDNSRCFDQGPTLQRIDVAHSIADAVTHLHYKKIVFRDLKPANIGFDHMGVVKLFDFGFAAGLPEKDEANPFGLLFDWCGSPRYMAPEVGLSLGHGIEADVYSFGLLFWEICALSKPFPSLTSMAELERDVYSGGKRPVIENHWPKSIKELMSSCWSGCPSERPTMLDVKFALSSILFSASNREERAPRRRSEVYARHLE